MTFLNCPQCGLSVIHRPGAIPDAICPRCRGRSGIEVPMYETDRPRPPGPAQEPEPRAA